MRDVLKLSTAKFLQKFGIRKSEPRTADEIPPDNARHRRPQNPEDWTTEQRYDYLVENSQPFLTAWEPTDGSIYQIVNALLDAEILVQVSIPEKWREEASERYGLTVLAANRKPLIWINLAKHRQQANCNDELADTLVHEALHASALNLGRHTLLADDPRSAAYRAEEVCVHSGAVLVQNALQLPGAPRNRRLASRAGERLSRPAREAARLQGQAAANWLLERVRPQ